MASSTAYEATYLVPSAANRIPTAAGRGLIAGAVFNLRRQLQDGNSAAVAHQVTDNPRILDFVDRAARSTGVQAIKTDYLAIDSA